MNRTSRRVIELTAVANVALAGCGAGLPPELEGFSSQYEVGDEIGDESTDSGTGESTESETNSTESETNSTESETDSTESTETNSTQSETDSAETESETGDPPCEIHTQLGPQLPIEWFEELNPAPSEETSACGGAGPERRFGWVAPISSTYSFDTIGSEFDTSLALTSECGGEVLVCHDNITFGDKDSRIIQWIEAGEPRVIVVDSENPNSLGDFTLHIEAMACPEQLLAGPLPIIVEGSTVGAANEMGSESKCGGGMSGEHAFVFTAPQDGLYLIDTIGSSFDTSLWVYEGHCGLDELVCNNDTDGQLSWVSLELAAGEVVTVVVDGWFGAEGDYMLTIDKFGPEPSDCPDAELPAAVPIDLADTTVGASNDFFGACGGQVSVDRSYRFTAPSAGVYSFDTLGSEIDTTLSLRSACEGAELTCNDDIDWFTTASRVVRELAAGESVIVVVDGSEPVNGAIELHVEAISCVDETAPSTTSWTTSGQTLGGTNRVGSVCGGGQAPDWVVEWVAPQTGIFTAATAGSDYDTVLHARAGGCNAAPMTCNDDVLGLGGTLTSRIEVQAVAGETLLFGVDGHGSDAGNFSLSLEPACDPFNDTCGAGQVCARVGSAFACRPADDLPEGGACTFGTCGEGLVCASDIVLPCGQPCCARLCDTTAPVCGPGETCHKLLDLPGDPAWRANVGFCG